MKQGNLKHDDIDLLLHKQRDFFDSNRTKEISFRIDMLKKLYAIIEKNENRIIDALYLDLHKGITEAYTSEISFILKEIEKAISSLKKWNKPKKVWTPLINFPAKSYYCYEPYGIALIIAPWNYPFGLTMSPLIGAISAGNCAILKPSEMSVNTAKLMSDLINSNFPPEYIRVVEGDAEAAKLLINKQINYIFFTGSTEVGKEIMKSAAEHLIPLTLELGGKNPCIVDNEVDIDVTARRVIWGKFFNAGQTCIAPDYLMVHNDIKDDFMKSLVKAVDEFHPDLTSDSKDYSHIINEKHFKRICDLMKDGIILIGGQTDETNLFISPTIITEIDYDSKIMQEEIFGPLLPIMFYDNLTDVISKLKTLPKPLTLYYFSKNKKNQDKILAETSSGSVCINGTIHVIMNQNLPFGGVGQSGMGSYHGQAGFETFSHRKSVIRKSFKLDFKAMYPPYKTKLSILKQIIKRLYIL
ncbi:MAG: aldehyde dehydrogenase [Ignavibacteriae bacterium HGW-Ignavibacteriae-1]|jgi:aldehyde dehydrogenase (NAD+)|nr:MAG: aldehyde dehydrogenase [Ignavibacteriae bacterium HGW-Ignavibacteriae-1]